MKDSILHRYCLVQFFFEFMFSCRCILNHNPYGTCLDQQPSVFWLVSLNSIGWNFLDLLFLSFVTCTFPGWCHIPNAWRSSARASLRLVNQSLLSCSALQGGMVTWFLLFCLQGHLPLQTCVSLLYHFSLLYLHLSFPQKNVNFLFTWLVAEPLTLVSGSFSTAKAGKPLRHQTLQHPE